MKKLTVKDALAIRDKSYEEAVQILYGVDIKNVPLGELYKYQIAKKEGDTYIADEYVIEGRTYKVCKDITAVTYSQFVDFTAYAKADDLVGMVSCFLIPKDHNYNDGYDLNVVKEDINGCDYYTVKDYAFFLQQQSAVFLNLFLTYSQQTKKKGATGETEEEQTALNYWQSLWRMCKRLTHLLMKQ